MHPNLTPLLLILLPTLALTATTTSLHPPLYTTTLHYLPTSPSTPSPHPLATLAYHPLHPSLSSLTSFHPPPTNSDPDALVQIAIYAPTSSPISASNENYTSSATSIRGFHPPYKGRFRIVVRPESGEVVGVSWRAWTEPKATQGKGGGKWKSDGQGKGKGDFDILTVKEAPVVVFDKPVKGKGGAAAAAPAAAVGEEGQEEAVEKTLLQKYWWLLLGVAVLAMTGGGGEK